MKSNSNTRPERFIDLGGRYLFNFNIIESVTESGGTSYDCECVEIKSATKDEIVKAIIHDRYSIDDEIALVNNYNAGLHIDEYNAYQDYRTEAKRIANESIQ